jgi:hypothetical protein
MYRKKCTALVICFLSTILFQTWEKKMNTNLNKIISSAAVVLAMVSTASAQSSRPQQKTQGGCPCPPFEQSMPLTNCESFQPAYNAPARVDVKCSWDVFLTASFLYWDMNQEGMEIGYNTTASADYNTVYAPSNGIMASQPGAYKPGFKIGLGADFGLDSWVGYLEYTWMHGTKSASWTPAAQGPGAASVIRLADWLKNDGYTPLAIKNLSSRWKVKLDLLDATLSRPYYQGTNLTVTPYTGVRAAWIRQNFTLTAAEFYMAPIFQLHKVSANRSTSWGVGPRAGIQGHWQLGWGFRLEGDVGANLLYTRYTQVYHGENLTPSASLAYRNYGQLRPMADMGLGIGWGSYFDCQNYYLDFSANYDFIYMWAQNMMRKLADSYNSGTSAQANDLSFNGLTLTGRFDF